MIGILLNLCSCRVLLIDDLLAVITPEMRGRRMKMRCAHLPGFKHMKYLMVEIARKLELNGMGFMDAKITGSNQVKVFEINARISASMHSEPRLLAKFMRAWNLAYLGDKYKRDYGSLLYVNS